MPSTPTGQGLGYGTFWQIVAVVQLLERAGFDQNIAARLRSEPDYVTRLVAAAKQGAILEPLSLQRARTYYCAHEKNFFGPREWWRLVGTPLTPDHLRLVEQFPWPAELIDERDQFDDTKHNWDTHIAFPLWVATGSAERLEMISLKWLFHRFESLFFQAPGTEDLSLAPYQLFRETVAFPRWYLVRLGVPEVTTGKTLREQLACVPEEYEPAPALAATAAHLFYMLAHGGFSRQTIMGRCGDILPGDRCVYVSPTQESLHVELGVTGAKSHLVGLNLMRKLPVSK